MTNTSYLNLFPVRARRRPSNVQSAADAAKDSNTSSSNSPFSGDRVDRAFDLMGRWHAKSASPSSLELTALPH